MSKNGLTLQLEREAARRYREELAAAQALQEEDIRLVIAKPEAWPSQTTKAEDQILDYFNGAGEGRKAFGDLIRAVYEEEPKQALAALDQAISAVALWRVE